MGTRKKLIGKKLVTVSTCDLCGTDVSKKVRCYVCKKTICNNCQKNAKPPLCKNCVGNCPGCGQISILEIKSTGLGFCPNCGYPI